MDALIAAAARALSAGDPFAALNRIALRDDPPALALRGIAMAQLGDLVSAKSLLRAAARAFGPGEIVARARCVVAAAEVALASRDLRWPAAALDAARTTLETYGDRVNATHARYLDIRRLLLIGRLDEAEQRLGAIDRAALCHTHAALHELLLAGVAIRRTRASAARSALDRAADAARAAGIALLNAEIESVGFALATPVARRIARDGERPVLLADVEALQASDALVVDACRHRVSRTGVATSVATRPVLFVLLRILAEAWPDDVPRTVLIARAFRAKHADESHRVRLRVELGRLRRTLRPLVVDVRATQRGFVLAPPQASEVVVLARPVEEQHADVLALLADGESWSSSALAVALGTGQRTVQRALESLSALGKVQSLGRGRSRRWIAPPPAGFATALLLPAPLLDE